MWKPSIRNSCLEQDEALLLVLATGNVIHVEQGMQTIRQKLMYQEPSGLSDHTHGRLDNAVTSDLRFLPLVRAVFGMICPTCVRENLL